MNHLLDAARKIKTWRENPVQFVWDNFKVEPDPWQRELLTVFPSLEPSKIRISMQACAGPGKSAALCWCGWNFISCYGERGEHPKAAAVSITEANLKDNLWAEFSKWQSRSPFLLNTFEWNQKRISSRDHPETWFISARSFSKTADSEEQGRTLSGLHSKFVLYLIDESGDIPPAVLKSAEQGLSTKPEFGKILQAGNPTSLDGMLYAAATTLANLWYRIRITGDPDDPNRSSRIDPDWAHEQINQYGRNNPWVMAFILGLFPPSSINTLLGPDEVEEAMHRSYPPDVYERTQKRLGVDVARFGDDRTVIFPRQGLMAFIPAEMRNARTQEIAARVAQARAKWGSTGTSDILELIDGSGGYGAGVIDSLIQSGSHPMEVSFSGKATDPRYLNKRAEMWFEMTNWIRRGGALPRNATLAKELTAPTYSFVQGKFQLEPKDQLKKRLGFSPDYADALALTFAMADQPAQVHELFNDRRSVTDWDPFDDSRR